MVPSVGVRSGRRSRRHGHTFPTAHTTMGLTSRQPGPVIVRSETDNERGRKRNRYTAKLATIGSSYESHPSKTSKPAKTTATGHNEVGLGEQHRLNFGSERKKI